jgi:hypothetical protein
MEGPMGITGWVLNTALQKPIIQRKRYHDRHSESSNLHCRPLSSGALILRLFALLFVEHLICFLIRVKNLARRNRMNLSIIFQHLIIPIVVFSCAVSNPAGKKMLKNQAELGEITIKETAQMEAAPRQRQSYVPGQVLVKFKDGVDEQAIHAIKEAMSLETIRVVRRPSLFLMRILNESSVEAVIERLSDFPEVSYAEPNYRVTAH